MDLFLGVIVGLLVLMALVVAHEFGHFLAARRNGVKSVSRRELTKKKKTLKLASGKDCRAQNGKKKRYQK